MTSTAVADANVPAAAPTPESLAARCERELLSFPGPKTPEFVKAACAKVVKKDECVSAEGVEIYHYDKISKDPKAKKVLVFSLIHGDETPAGSVGRYWMERLEGIDPRNTWRVVPVLNPDGVKRKTRTNANKIDLNRNFPTKDWDEMAQKLWKAHTSSNPRRFPGQSGGSEPEVKCALKHIEDFAPDFIVSIHTPLKVLDFDGPSLKKKPKFDYLPWKSLGTFPGSLGRYMWFERKTPVLTMELEDRLPGTYQPFESLQDIIGSLTVFETDDSPAAPKKAAEPAAKKSSALPAAPAPGSR
ncbi:MAG: DUF2817 domain-containing protein [Bdellovibrionaceae bacterium]|nr:DUF2817 domain-containing protein [Pseudobdellovibrionaceae bacterium]